jgi:hypothetical protein
LLDYAIKEKLDNFAVLLISLGIVTDYTDSQGRTPIQVVEQLLSEDLEEDDSTTAPLEKIKECLEALPHLSDIDTDEITLAKAVEYNLTKKVQLILEADLQNKKAELGANSVASLGLVNQTIRNGNFIVLRMLLKAGASNYINWENGSSCLTHLIYTCQNSHTFLSKLIAEEILNCMHTKEFNFNYSLGALVGVLLDKYDNDYKSQNFILDILIKLNIQRLAKQPELNLYLTPKNKKCLSNIIAKLEISMAIKNIIIPPQNPTASSDKTETAFSSATQHIDNPSTLPKPPI